MQEWLHLIRIDRTRNMARFYAISVEPTLFGDWAVVQRWGRIGTFGRMKTTHFAAYTEAMAAKRATEQAKRRRGYDACTFQQPPAAPFGMQIASDIPVRLVC